MKSATIQHFTQSTSGLPRRFVPRNDGGIGTLWAQESAQGTSGLPRRFAPRNDGGIGTL